jgi:chaperone BCS1
MLFVGLPRKCIVLLEDIDCAGVQRTSRLDLADSDGDSSDDNGGDEGLGSDDEPHRGGPKSKSSKGSKDKKRSNRSNDNAVSPPPRQPRMSVSFSGLLNAIDGVASHEGRILIMTTNHRERLDPALIRPGRVDMQIEFGFACKATLAEIFRELYSSVDGIDSATVEAEEEVFGGEDEPLLPPTEKNDGDREEQYRSTIYEFSERFADMIPENKFTPAEIQGFLMSYKRAPRFALERLPTWLRGKIPVEMDGKSGRRSKAKGDKKKVVKDAAKPSEVPERGKLTVTVSSVAPVTPPQRMAFQSRVSEGATGGLQLDKSNFDVDMVARKLAQMLMESVKMGGKDVNETMKPSIANPVLALPGNVPEPEDNDSAREPSRQPALSEKREKLEPQGIVDGEMARMG